MKTKLTKSPPTKRRTPRPTTKRRTPRPSLELAPSPAEPPILAEDSPATVPPEVPPERQFLEPLDNLEQRVLDGQREDDRAGGPALRWMALRLKILQSKRLTLARYARTQSSTKARRCPDTGDSHATLDVKVQAFGELLTSLGITSPPDTVLE